MHQFMEEGGCRFLLFVVVVVVVVVVTSLNVETSVSN